MAAQERRFCAPRQIEFEATGLQEPARTCRNRERKCLLANGHASYFGQAVGFAPEWEVVTVGHQSSSMVASGSSRIGIPLRMGYTRLHSLHLRASSPRMTNGFRHTGQASISNRSGLIMAVILARRPG